VKLSEVIAELEDVLEQGGCGDRNVVFCTTTMSTQYANTLAVNVETPNVIKLELVYRPIRKREQ
jgi:hypothetical protein